MFTTVSHPRARLWRASFVAIITLGIVAAGSFASPSPARAATIDPAAWYQIVSRHSGKAIDVCGVSTGNGACIQQWSRSSGHNQQFQFADVGDGYYQLRARHSGKLIDIEGGSTADGANVIQWPDNGGWNQHFRVADSDSGYVRLINRQSNKALDVWEWSTADGGRISQYTDHNGWNQQWQLIVVDGGGGDPTGPVGWATQGGGTTGGSGGPTVTVSTLSALNSALNTSGSAIIRVSGTISCSGMLSVTSNKSILGNSGATIAGCGLNISEDSNVIVRNIMFRDWNDDAINVQYSTRVWIDHNTFTNGYDGAVDIKRAADYVTVSWNRIYGHSKSMLLGHSDNNADEDVGRLRVTYHHNWLDGSGTRHPRVRFGNPVHVFNNFYYSNGYGVASTMNAGVLVEGNYFENVDDPTLVGYGSSDPGNLVERNNFFTGSGSPESTGGGVNSIPYPYSLDSASSVKSIVTAGAGAGQITV